MITIHEKTAQNFNTLGLGALLPSSCVVTEEVNGAYELKMEHPYDSEDKWKRIERGRIIYASTPRGMQPFRIYNVKPNMKSIEVNARHIFYDLLDNQCSEISFNGTASGALTALQGAFAFAMPFSFDTDISALGTMTTGRMNPVQALLSDDDETTSFVKGFGGELLRDGLKVSLKTAMGQDRDVAIRYGKNLVGLDVTEDEADVKTRILCYGSDGNATVESPYINEYVYPKIHTLEDEDKTVAELKAEAQALFDGGADLPLVNIKVDFIILADTVEYADYAPLEEVFLGDIVTIINQKMNFAKKARVIFYEWDCLLEKYNEVELGDFMPTLAASVTSGVRSGSLASAAAVGTSAVSAALQAHLNDFNNPHKTPTGGGSGTGDADAVLELLVEHEENKENPHGVTAAQVGAYTTEEVDEKLKNVSGGSGILSGTLAPDSTNGSDGDVYLQIPEETEYTELEYLQSSGAQFVNTEIIPTTDTKVVIEFEWTSIPSNSWLTVFGSRTTSSSQDQFNITTDTGNSYAGFASQELTLTAPFNVVGKRYTVVIDKNGVTVNGVSAGTYTQGLEVVSNYPMYIFGRNNAGAFGNGFIGRIFLMQIYKSGSLVRDYIPVKNPSSVPCLYDKVTKAYSYNKGSGAFTAGTELEKETASIWLKQNGTWTQVLKGAA